MQSIDLDIGSLGGPMATRKKGARAREARTAARAVRQLLKAARDVAATDAPRTGAHLLPGGADHAARRAALSRAWRTQRGLERAAKALADLRARVPIRGHAASLADPRIDVVLARYLGKRGPELRRRAAGGLARLDLGSFDEIVDHALAQPAIHLARVLRPLASMRAMSGDAPRVQPQAGGDDGEPVGTDPHESSSTGVTPSSSDTNVLVIVIAVITVIGIFIALLSELVNDTDDDLARDEIAAMKCSQIVATSDGHWIAQFTKMIDGPTADEDEVAMIKVLDCLPHERIRHIVEHFGVTVLLDEFQGSEFDQLQVILGAAGLLKWADWNDNATRIFVHGVSKDVLALLSVTTIVQLCRNMFDGDCGDEDEIAILRLLKAQDACKLKLVMKQISFDEFDDNVDGAEWDQLSSLLTHAKQVTC